MLLYITCENYISIWINKQPNTLKVTFTVIMNNPANLFQILHHFILTAIQYAAEKLYNLFVIEVVDILHHSWEKQLHCQVQISSKLI